MCAATTTTSRRLHLVRVRLARAAAARTTRLHHHLVLARPAGAAATARRGHCGGLLARVLPALAPGRTLLRGLAVPGLVTTPRLARAVSGAARPAPTARRLHHVVRRGCAPGAPTTARSRDCHGGLARPARAAAARSSHRRSSLARPSRAAPTRSRDLRRGLTGLARLARRLAGLAGGTTTTGLFGGSCHVGFLAGDYGLDAVAEWDRAFDLETLRVELPKTDVLVSDVDLAVLVPVRLRPLLRLARRPLGSAEEQGLDVGRRRTLTLGRGDAVADLSERSAVASERGLEGAGG